MTSVRETSKGPSEIAHFVHNCAHPLPKGAVLVGVLKSVERELTRRGMIGTSARAVTPLWFLAETERNIFLWRNGKSLDDQRDFDFWVHVPELLAKRREQLGRAHGLNPFINPLWGGAPLDETLIEEESAYLDEFEELTAVILPHAEALSHASRDVRRDLSPTAAERITVLLPVKRKSA